MPSKLPIIKANTTQENIDKMKVIAQANKRSVAKELEYLVEQRIKEYEAEFGEINIDQSKNAIFQEAVIQMCEPFYDMIKTMANKSNTSTREAWNTYLAKQSDKKKSKQDFQVIYHYVESRLADEETE